MKQWEASMDIKQVESIPWITHSSATQVLVVGGGPSGVCAAVAAARQRQSSHTCGAGRHLRRHGDAGARWSFYDVL